MPDRQRPRSFEEAVLADLRDPPVIAFSTGDSPGQRSIYDGAAVMDTLIDFYRRLDYLPHLLERVSVHPDELDAFLGNFPHPQPPQPGMIGAVCGVPLVTDPSVPLNTARVRTGIEERDYPIRQQPLRRAHWWRWWRRTR